MKMKSFEKVLARIGLLIIGIFVILTIYFAVVGNTKLFLGFIFATLLLTIIIHLLIQNIKRKKLEDENER